MQPAHILLTDRNRHVREFLQRELVAAGYTVTPAASAQEILLILAAGQRPDLLILDLDIPFVFETDLLTQLQTFYPSLPILMHSFLPENPQVLAYCSNCAFLEKVEDPEPLKDVVATLLNKKQETTRGQAG